MNYLIGIIALGVVVYLVWKKNSKPVKAGTGGSININWDLPVDLIPGRDPNNSPTDSYTGRMLRSLVS